MKSLSYSLFVDFWNKLPIMAPWPDVVWCVGFIKEPGGLVGGLGGVGFY